MPVLLFFLPTDHPVKVDRVLMVQLYLSWGHLRTFRVPQRCFSVLTELWLEYSLGSGIILTLQESLKGLTHRLWWGVTVDTVKGFRGGTFIWALNCLGWNCLASQSFAGPPLPTVKLSSCLLERSGWWSLSIHIFCSCTCDLEVFWNPQ